MAREGIEAPTDTMDIVVKEENVEIDKGDDVEDKKQRQCKMKDIIGDYRRFTIQCFRSIDAVHGRRVEVVGVSSGLLQPKCEKSN